MNFLTADSMAIRLSLTLLILVIGHLFVRLYKQGVSKLVLEGREGTIKDVKDLKSKIQYSVYILDAGVIGFALFYLNSSTTEGVASELASYLPELLSAVLIAILGVIAINIFTKLTEDFLKTIGIRNYFRDAGLSVNSLKAVSSIIKAFLYLVLLQLVLGELGIAESTISELVLASSWAVAFLAAGLIFYGFKDLFKNFAAGVYLKNSRLVRPGEEVRIDDESGEINQVSLFSTSVSTNSGYTILAPNHKIVESDLKFKRTKSDLDTLDEISNYFVAQHPSYCGPASMEMALEIFGYRHSQDEIGEKANLVEDGGVEEDDLMDAVEELTNSEIKTAWIQHDKISDLGDEYKAWFNDGALIVSNFFKPEIFPEATAGHFVLSVGAEDNEILNIDPSGTNGGVYYVNKDTLYDAMGDFGHQRGYIVVAPKGTTAYWRIKNDLIYADRNLYSELSKTLESRLKKILRKGRILKNATPESVDEYMQDWTADQKLTRVWKPEGFTGDKEELGGEQNEDSKDKRK